MLSGHHAVEYGVVSHWHSEREWEALQVKEPGAGSACIAPV